MDATLSGCTYITCPYCGREDKDSWEEDEEGVIECQCGKSFGFDRIVDVTYTMKKNERKEIDTCKWKTSKLGHGLIVNPHTVILHRESEETTCPVCEKKIEVIE